MKIELNVSEYSQLQLSIIDSRIEYENRLSLLVLSLMNISKLLLILKSRLLI